MRKTLRGEVETELLISLRLGFLSNEEYQHVTERLDEIGRMITGLCAHLRAKAAGA